MTRDFGGKTLRQLVFEGLENMIDFEKEKRVRNAESDGTCKATFAIALFVAKMAHDCQSRLLDAELDGFPASLAAAVRSAADAAHADMIAHIETAYGLKVGDVQELEFGTIHDLVSGAFPDLQCPRYKEFPA